MPARGQCDSLRGVASYLIANRRSCAHSSRHLTNHLRTDMPPARPYGGDWPRSSPGIVGVDALLITDRRPIWGWGIAFSGESVMMLTSRYRDIGMRGYRPVAQPQQTPDNSAPSLCHSRYADEALRRQPWCSICAST